MIFQCTADRCVQIPQRETPKRKKRQQKYNSTSFLLDANPPTMQTDSPTQPYKCSHTNVQTSFHYEIPTGSLPHKKLIPYPTFIYSLETLGTHSKVSGETERENRTCAHNR